VGSITFGILGTGSAAQAFVRALRGIPSISAGAVGSRSDSAAREFAKSFGIPRAHGDYASLAADPTIDVVYIATPPTLHRENALLCLESGKSILVEKPFAPTATQAQQIISAARHARLFCMEAMWTRFLPATRQFVDRAKSGEIGKLHHFYADFGLPVVFNASNHRFDALGGGAWIDRGIYGLSMAMALFGEPVSIHSGAIVADTGCDLQSHALLQFPQQRCAVISASNLAYTSNEAVLAGSLGRLRLTEPFVRSEAVRARAAPADASGGTTRIAKTTIKDAAKSIRFFRKLAALLPKERTSYHPLDGNGYAYEALEVARCLQNGLIESPIMPLDESKMILEVSDAVRAGWLSVDSGAP
jgi:predicted dehydrogenase